MLVLRRSSFSRSDLIFIAFLMSQVRKKQIFLIDQVTFK